MRFIISRAPSWLELGGVEAIRLTCTMPANSLVCNFFISRQLGPRTQSGRLRAEWVRVSVAITSLRLLDSQSGTVAFTGRTGEIPSAGENLWDQEVEGIFLPEGPGELNFPGLGEQHRRVS